MNVQSEAASADAEAAASYPYLGKIIYEGGDTQQRIFNVDITAFWRKKMLSRTFIAREEESTSAFKALKDSIRLVLGANTADDLKVEASAHLPVGKS